MPQLHDVRCSCGRLIGKINGRYEIKCPRCKLLQSGVAPKPLSRMYDKVKGE